MLESRARTTRPIVAALLALGIALAGVTSSAATPTHGRTTAKVDPRRTEPFYVDPSMQDPAVRANAAFRPITSRPQAFWLTTSYSIGGTDWHSITGAVRGYVQSAEAAHRIPLMALYAILHRDCGGHASGGLPSAAAYKRYVHRAATAAAGSHAVVVVEPDAVPFLNRTDCGNTLTKERLLRYAVNQFAAAGAWVYLDAGHSRWYPAATIARLLVRSGIAGARGFSLNVANFRPTGAERSYARAINRALQARHVAPKRFVIETARNGARTPPDPSDVCNPVQARLGRAPELVFSGRLDGYVWVKQPGKSDGSGPDCHGGGIPGEWWDTGARRLLGLT